MAGPLLLGCQGLTKSYGARTLFEGVSFGIFDGDRACLVGPNGSGKTTLLKILAGLETPDRGARSVHGRLRVGYVAQDPVFPSGVTVADAASAALDHVEADERAGRIALALGRASFADARTEVDALSGGWKKRLAIARELAAAPDLLLMDEPTNHLDVDGILWLEELLVEQARAFLVVSHDRYFLERVATRVLELNRVYPDGLFATDGRYSEFLARRDDALRGQAAYEESLANLVRREIAWLRRGAKARSTKAKGRIREAGRLIEETTLLDVLAGTLAPDRGAVERAEALRLVRFEQHRARLDPEQTLRRALAPEGDTVTFQGRSLHVASWAKRFLFRP